MPLRTLINLPLLPPSTFQLFSNPPIFLFFFEVSSLSSFTAFFIHRDLSKTQRSTDSRKQYFAVRKYLANVIFCFSFYAYLMTVIKIWLVNILFIISKIFPEGKLRLTVFCLLNCPTIFFLKISNFFLFCDILLAIISQFLVLLFICKKKKRK